jgi:hypothetical protein
VFINNVISFAIVAFALFMVIKAMNRLRRTQEEEPAKEPPPSREVQLLQDIRDALVRGRRRNWDNNFAPDRFPAMASLRIVGFGEKISTFYSSGKPVCGFSRFMGF